MFSVFWVFEQSLLTKHYFSEYFLWKHLPTATNAVIKAFRILLECFVHGLYCRHLILDVTRNVRFEK